MLYCCVEVCSPQDKPLSCCSVSDSTACLFWSLWELLHFLFSILGLLCPVCKQPEAFQMCFCNSVLKPHFFQLLHVCHFCPNFDFSA